MERKTVRNAPARGNFRLWAAINRSARSRIILSACLLFGSIALVTTIEPPKPTIAQMAATNNVPQWMVTRAFMRTIFVAEGTWYEGTKRDPYRTEVFTYNQIGDFSDHPHNNPNSKLPCAYIGSEWTCSAATGAAQWMPDTWNRVRALKRFWFDGKAFSPENQDMAMLYELERVGSLKTLFNGISLKNGVPSVNRRNFDIAMSQAAPVWASLPRFRGDDSGAYGQGTRSSEKLWRVFQTELAKEQRQWKSASAKTGR